MTAKTVLPRHLYARVSRSKPCPVCEKPDWCLLARDGSHAICARVAVGGRFCGEPGWRHDIGNASTPTTAPSVREKAKIDASAYATAFERALTHEQRAMVASDLGVSADSLRRLRMGWCAEHEAPTFPMWVRGQIVGIRIRKPDGSKFAIRDSSNGFFIPRGLGDSTILIVEGPTDCAAALDMGYDAIGKPNASACTDELIRFLLDRHTELAVFMGENDNPDARGKVAGIDGPRAQCERAKKAGIDAVFVLPPTGKDLREWASKHGGSREKLDRIVENAG